MKQKNVKQVIARMTLHRFTASKQPVVILHKLGNCISYVDRRLQNDAWARMVSASGRVSNEMAKGISTHATMTARKILQPCLEQRMIRIALYFNRSFQVCH